MLEHELYPEIHRMLMPAVIEAAASHDGSGLDEHKIDRMTQYAVSRSGIMRRPPRGHNRQSIYDFARFMLLCRLMGGCQFPRHPLFPPVLPISAPAAFVPAPNGNMPPHTPAAPNDPAALG